MKSKVFKSEFMKTALLLVVVVIGVVGFWLALRAALKTEYPLHAVVSGSMVPALHVGDLLVVQGVQNACEIEVGDIIVFRSPRNPSEFIVHRAIGKTQEGGMWYFQTKGDNNLGPDPLPVPDHEVVGKVVGRIPLLGYLKIYLGTPVGMAAIIILMLILLFADHIPFPHIKKAGKDKGGLRYA